MSPAKRKTPSKTASSKKKKPSKPTAKKSAAKSSRAKTASKTASRSASKKKNEPVEFFDHNVSVARELASIAQKHRVSELIYETDELTLTIRRGAGASAAPQFIAAPAAPIAVAAPAPVAPAAAPAAPAAATAEAAVDDNLHVVTSPFVGTFYRAPNPDSPAYCEPGQSVTKGQVLCIVEAMKLMNEIEADVNGTIKTILVKNAESVEYGQPLFKIEPA